jgi:dihydrofolate reductase
MAENRVIGRDGSLPWRLPRDMRRFKTLTTGHTVVMGRKTFETLSAPLPNRRSVVLTRDATYRVPGVDVAHDLQAALSSADRDAEVFIAGGGDVYAKALPLADRIHLTVVHASFEGDTTFPPFAMEDWQLVEDVRFDTDARHAFAHSFRRYERRTDRR